MVHYTNIGFFHMADIQNRRYKCSFAFNEDFFGIGGHFDIEEMYAVLPEIKLLTFFIAFGFIILHGFSGKVGMAKYWIAKQGPILWGVICGLLLSLMIYLRPAEIVEFIYFRF